MSNINQMSNKSFIQMIRDPVHGTMYVPSFVQEYYKYLIDHPHFQRLRYIRQLGLKDLLFPGGIHTRFNHCLGTSFVASKICHILGLNEQESKIAVLGAFLHDIGHGPFSHGFEKIYPISAKIRHELWTHSFFNDFKNDYKGQKSAGLFETLDIIESIIHKSDQKTNDYSIAKDIISSQLDADRIDYILRDAHFCGVEYGRFDIQWLLNSLMIVNVRDGTNEEIIRRLGIKRKGIAAVEQYLLSRRMMAQNVYLHAKGDVMEFILVEFLKKLAEMSTDDTFRAKMQTLGISKPLLEFLKNVYFNDSKPKEFIQENFSFYKSLTDHDVVNAYQTLAREYGDDDLSQMARVLYFRKLPKTYSVQHYEYVERETSAYRLQKGWPTWRIGVNQPTTKLYNSSAEMIYIAESNRDLKNLSDVSPIINALSDVQEKSDYLYVDREFLSDPQVIEFVESLKLKGYIVEL